MGTDALRKSSQSASPLVDNGRGQRSSSLSMPMVKIGKVKSKVNSNLSKSGTVKKSKSKSTIGEKTIKIRACMVD